MTTGEESGAAASGREWSITTTDGRVTSGHLPPWAQDDPSKAGVEPDRLRIELADITHEKSFGGCFIPVCSGAEELGTLKAMLVAHMQCRPFTDGGDPDEVCPLVNIQLLDDLWIRRLGLDGVAKVAEKFRRFADLLVYTVTPALYAARGDWAAHVRKPGPR